MESLAVNDIFGDKVSCASTKGITGHTLGAAGALEAAILWIIVNHQINTTGALPVHRANGIYDSRLPHIHLTEINEYFKSNRRIGLSTSFAFGGNNTALIIGNNYADAN